MGRICWNAFFEKGTCWDARMPFFFLETRRDYIDEVESSNVSFKVMPMCNGFCMRA